MGSECKIAGSECSTQPGTAGTALPTLTQAFVITDLENSTAIASGAPRQFEKVRCGPLVKGVLRVCRQHAPLSLILGPAAARISCAFS